MRSLAFIAVAIAFLSLARAQGNFTTPDYCSVDSNNVTTVCTSCTNSTGCSQCSTRSYQNPWRVLTSQDVGYNRCLTCDVALNCSSQNACSPGGVNDLPGCECKRGEFQSTVSLPSLDANGSTIMTTYKGACTSCMAAFNCSNCNANGCLGCPNGAVPNLRDQADGSTVTVCVACQTIDANCVQCYTSGNLTNTCTACKQGYFLNSTGGCSPCSAGCAQCTSATQCTRCTNRGSIMINGTCTTCSAAFNCTNCNANGCLGCPNGKVKSHREQDGRTVTVCTTCQSIDPNCVQCYTSGGLAGTCNACKQGFFHNSTGGCTACSAGCAQCNSATQCSRCINRSDRVINGVCTTCAATTGDANCVSCTSNGLTCTGCKEGYTRDPSTGVCTACSSLVTNCKQCIYNASGTPVCHECVRGYRGPTCTPILHSVRHG